LDNPNTLKIEELIRPLIESSGLTLYDVEFVGRILRVSIEKVGGVGINECVETSRMLNPLLDVEDVVSGGSYELEVSSPGLDRNLRRPEHFQGALGEKIKLTTGQPLVKWNVSDAYFEKRKNFSGVLKEYNEGFLIIIDESREVKIPLSEVTRAYIDFELKTTPKKGKKV
jgi:ribosome maturation factor RimP